MPIIPSAKPLKFFIFINHLKSGGAEKQSIYLTRALINHYDAELIVYDGDLYDERMLSLIEGIEDHVIWLKGNHLARLIFIYRLFTHQKNTAVISYLTRINFINAVIGLLAGVKLRIGGIRSSRIDPVKLIIQRILHNRLLTCSIFNNYSGLEYLKNKGFNPDKAFVIPNGILINREPILRQKKNELIILSVGRFIEAKDYKTAIDSIIDLKKSYNNLKYIIVGHGHLEMTLKDYVNSLCCDNFIEFIINPVYINQYYEKADIFLSTSLYEGFCNAIMEALEFSLPVVATNVGDNSKLIKDGFNGFITPVKDINTISQKLFLLVENSDLRIQMGNKGYQLLKENYSIEKFTEKHISLINMLSEEVRV
jgi:glycosyltransferase involved in cell wall biosynthesis